jgi:hypothetical protein
MVETLSEIYGPCCSSGLAKKKKIFAWLLRGFKLDIPNFLEIETEPSTVRPVYHGRNMPVPDPGEKFPTDDANENDEPVPM